MRMNITKDLEVRDNGLWKNKNVKKRKKLQWRYEDVYQRTRRIKEGKTQERSL
jgi:hypothetical protein